jgi:6-pyruvoyltetrahydropterin/6-carboxytetrahydropterin synthase
MYEVSVRQHFDAAHALRGYGGRCENLHGHRFEVEVTLRGSELNDIGILYDFTELKAHLRELVKHLDHTNLNDNHPFDSLNPSSENIARFLYGELKGRLGQASTLLSRVQVWESPESRASYQE